MITLDAAVWVYGCCCAILATVQMTFVSTTGHTAGAFWDVILLMNGATDVTQPGTTEFLPCGGQGLCNLGTGLCTCTGIGM